MKKRSLLIVALVLVLMLLLSLIAFAAPRYRVSSKIGGTQYGATQEIGHFRVGPNGSASAFQGGAHVISSAQNQAVGYGFHIERIGTGNQKTVTVFERSWNGKIRRLPWETWCWGRDIMRWWWADAPGRPPRLRLTESMSR